MISKAERAIIDNDIEKIVSQAVNPPKNDDIPVSISMPSVKDFKINEQEKIDELVAFIKTKDPNIIKAIFDAGHGDGFVYGNIMQILYQKNHTKKDLLQLAHYVILLICLHDQKIKNEEKN